MKSDEIEDILEGIEELRPQDIYEDAEPRLREPDEDDLMDILVDCHLFVSALLTIKTSKWVADDARDLSVRLGEILNFNRIH